ncbi:endothelin-converting enzyme 1-like [Paramacrobiotus metropolitanus]|uniref:endothelin-converting enzyme 1-like n=1 Tax=Paramacrobiotus metropolitanus TaxID=2943436 RepID=UPI0024464584|nr:endothelin-converting enzyme 1-like [Paramacrobiotus metropolitanus]
MHPIAAIQFFETLRFVGILTVAKAAIHHEPATFTPIINKDNPHQTHAASVHVLKDNRTLNGKAPFFTDTKIRTSNRGSNNATVSPQTSSYTKNERVCDTATCREIGAKILMSINVSADPCEDFYTYACGQWIDSQEIFDTEKAVSQFYLMEKLAKQVNKELLKNSSRSASSSEVKLKQLYKQCSNEDQTNELRARPVLDFLDLHMGGWPLVTANWNSSRFSVFRALVNSLAVGTVSFFNISIKADLEDPQTSIIYLEARKMHDIYDVVYREHYLNFFYNVTALVIWELNFTEVDGLLGIASNVHSGMEDIVILEKELYQRKTAHVYFTKTTLATFGEAHQFKSWLLKNMTSYIKAYCAEVGLTEQIDDNTTVIAANPKFWQVLDNILDELDKQGEQGLKRLANYIGWRVIEASVDHLSKKYRQKLAGFVQAVSVKGQKNRNNLTAEERCVDVVANAMPLAMGALYVREVVPNDLKTQVTAIVDGVEAEFKLLLASSSWMDASTQEAAQRKLARMQKIIAYPQFMASNISLIDAEYESANRY